MFELRCAPGTPPSVGAVDAAGSGGGGVVTAVGTICWIGCPGKANEDGNMLSVV